MTASFYPDVFSCFSQGTHGAQLGLTRTAMKHPRRMFQESAAWRTVDEIYSTC